MCCSVKSFFSCIASCAKTLPLHKNASALVVSESEKGNRFLLAVSFLDVSRSSNVSAVQQE